MSYILEALQRASAQRERGQLPSLQAQLQAWPVPSQASSRTGAARWWLLFGLGALAVAAIVWVMLRPGTLASDAQTPVAGLTPATTTTVRAPAPSLTPESARAPAPTGGASPPSSLAVLPAMPSGPTASVTATVAAAPAPASSAGHPPAKTRAAAKPTATKPAPRKPAAPPSPAPPTSESLPSLAELAPDLRAQVPDLSVSGVSYADSAAQRILIVNGKVFQEQDSVAPGVVLERIGPRSAVLRVQAQRFRLGY